jgi:hypothetical protein
VVEKTDSYTTLILFSMGITKGKWGTLLDALMDFKTLYDQQAPLERVLPDLVASYPQRYTGRTLRGLCQRMHDHLREARMVELLDTAFQDLPEPVAPPQYCYQRLIRGGTERVGLADAADRVAAAMVTVTPPGIPVLMPGENTGAPSGPLLRYLSALESFDRCFPGFHSETHGVTLDPDTGDYLIECLRRIPAQHTGHTAAESAESQDLQAPAPAGSSLPAGWLPRGCSPRGGHPSIPVVAGAESLPQRQGRVRTRAQDSNAEVRARIRELLDIAPFARYGYVEYADARAYSEQTAQAVSAISALTATERAAEAIALARETAGQDNCRFPWLAVIWSIRFPVRFLRGP